MELAGHVSDSLLLHVLEDEARKRSEFFSFCFLCFCLILFQTRFIVVEWIVVVVGLGSAFFHGTLTFYGQLSDEIPMLIGAFYWAYVVWHTQRQHHDNYYIAILVALLGHNPRVYWHAACPSRRVRSSQLLVD